MKLLKIQDWPILAAMTLPVLLPILIIFFYILPNVEEKYYEDKNEMLKSVVESAYSTIKDYDDNVEKGIMKLEKLYRL